MSAEITATRPATNTNFAITALSDLMAAEVTGINLASPLDAAVRRQIHAAFLEHRLLVFRDQNLT